MAPSPDERDRIADERERQAAAADEHHGETESVVSGDLFGIDLGQAGGNVEKPRSDETPDPAPAAPKTLTERLAAAAAAAKRRDPPS